MFVCHDALSKPYTRAPSFRKLRAVLILWDPEVHTLAKRNDFMIIVFPKLFLVGGLPVTMYLVPSDTPRGMSDHPFDESISSHQYDPVLSLND